MESADGKRAGVPRLRAPSQRLGSVPGPHRPCPERSCLRHPFMPGRRPAVRLAWSVLAPAGRRSPLPPRAVSPPPCGSSLSRLRHLDFLLRVPPVNSVCPGPSPAPCLIASCSPLARSSPACPHIPPLSQALPPVHILFAWRNPVRFLLHAASPDGPEHSSLPAWLPSGFVVHHLMSQSHRSRTCSLGGPAWIAGVRGTF